jgi:hypothetical protein
MRKNNGDLTFNEMERMMQAGLDPASYRATSGSGEKWISGYIARYDSPTMIGGKGGFTETLARGCFDKTIEDGHDIVSCFDHDTRHLLGRTSAGTLELKSDNLGLFFRCKLPEGVSYSQDVYNLVESRNLRGCSFAGMFTRDKWSNDWKTRKVIEIELLEGGPVSMPAYASTSVSIGKRSSIEAMADEALEVARRKKKMEKAETDFFGAEADKIIADALIQEHRAVIERADGSRGESVELRDLLVRFKVTSIQELRHLATVDAECRGALMALSIRADAQLKSEARYGL